MGDELQDPRERAAELIERGEGLRMVVAQDTGFFTVEPERIEGILGLLDDAMGLMWEVTERYDGATGGPDVTEAVLAPQELADLSFVGRSELRELRESLETAAESRNTWKIISESDRAVARTTRALVPIEAALREYSGLTPNTRRWYDIDDALEIRRAYVDFWIEARRHGTPKDADIVDRLRHFSTKIAELRKAKIYPFLRIDDRLEIRAIQKRIFAHLEDPGPDPALAGGRLWQDMVGFFDLLMHINRREELLEHDRLLAGRLLRELSDPASLSDPVSAETHERLRSLASQEPGLDPLLVADDPSRASAYTEPLNKLLQRLLAR
ncbi:MAG: hypothetical protein AAGD06_20600 [Acidobacteriota bacterium]